MDYKNNYIFFLFPELGLSGMISSIKLLVCSLENTLKVTLIEDTVPMV